jgi:hypothetical protein
MKNLFLFLTLFIFTAFSAFGGISAKKKSNAKTSNKIVGRECCTKTVAWGDNGATIQVTACAGWFLSNSENAHERACEKVDQAIEGYNSNW